MIPVLLTISLFQPAQPPAAPPASGCAQAMAAGMTAAATEICLAEEQQRVGEASAKGTVVRSRAFEAAAEHYRRAVSLASVVQTQESALNSLAQLYDTKYLNQLDQMEPVLRELIALQPNELAPVFRLAKLQEERGFIEAAEETLLGVRRLRPDALEPYMMLAQFYARRATALHQQREAREPAQPSSGPGEQDADGVYRVGGPIAPPARLDRAVYPPEAAAAGIEGVVLAEVVIGETGEVTDAKVVRSVPLLDEAALKAVRNWRFEPTVVNGQAVPVKMTVTVNFTTR